MSEQVGALFDHMTYNGKYMEDGFNLILSEISTRCGVRRDRQLLLAGGIDVEEEEDLALDFDEQVFDARNHENEKKLDEIQTKLEELEGKLSNAFEMSVEIASGPEDSPDLLVFTTLEGVPHKPAEIEIEGYDPSKKSNYVLDHGLIILDEGKVIVTLHESPQLLFVKATLNVGENSTVEHTQLVALK